MIHRIIFVSLTAVCLLRPTTSIAQSAPRTNELDYYRKEVAPILAKFCFTCHSGAKPKGELALDLLRQDPALAKNRLTWEKVVENLRNGSMPPRGKPRPAAGELERVAGWFDGQFAQLDGSAKRDPGRVTLRRLNRAEYNNTIRDLLGIDFQPAADFPADDVGYGFDNIGDVLSLPPLLMEKYLAAAEKIAGRAIVTPEQRRGIHEKLRAGKMESTPTRFPMRGKFRNIHSNGALFTHLIFPRDGDYVVRIQAFGDQAGKDPARMALRLDGRTVKTFDVRAVEGAEEVYEQRVRIEAGSHRLEAAFTNDFADRRARDPKKRDRNLLVSYVEVEGPFGAAPGLPDSHKRLIIAQPENSKQYEASAQKILEPFVSRAWRRPVNRGEVRRLVKLVLYAETQGDSFERGIQLAVQATLTSPHFIFRVELDPQPDNPEAVHYIRNYELASRLSYFLWSSMPDEELFAEAKKGTLRQNLPAQVKRMLKDPRSRALVDNFASQWLQTRNLKNASPDPGRFPGFDDKLRSAMLRETELFFEAIMREDRGILEFIDADYTFLNERLARHYGIDGVKGDEFRRVKLTDGKRGGVLTMASILTATSNPTRTSPVKRGKWILETILGTPPPPPPPDVPELNEKAELTGSLRQRMEQHRANALCASCHQRMDPLGFGFENYDAVGAWRVQEGKFPIDPSGELPGGRKFNGPAGLKALLKGQQKAVARCLAEKMLTYALGRGVEAYDKVVLDQIAAELGRNEYRFTSLIVAVVRSDPFLKRRGQK